MWGQVSRPCKQILRHHRPCKQILQHHRPCKKMLQQRRCPCKKYLRLTRGRKNPSLCLGSLRGKWSAIRT
jgi:hypothetical protein